MVNRFDSGEYAVIITKESDQDYTWRVKAMLYKPGAWPFDVPLLRFRTTHYISPVAHSSGFIRT